MNKANLRELKAATGLVILLKLDSNCRFLANVTLKFDGWPRKTIGHLFYTISNIVHHFKAIGEFKLELQSGKAQFGSCDLEIWWMTLKNNRAPFLYYVKLCASFQSHLLIQTRVTVWECSLRVKIRDFFVPCDLEIWQMTLKNNRHLFCATSNFVHHFIAISVFKLELQSGNAQFGWKLMIFFCPVWPWNTIRHLLYATWSFVHYLVAISEFKLELTVQKCPNLGQNQRFFYAIWPWNLPDDLEKQ